MHSGRAEDRCPAADNGKHENQKKTHFPIGPEPDPEKNGATGSHATLLESGYPPGYDGGLIRNESDMSVVGGSGHDRM